MFLVGLEVGFGEAGSHNTRFLGAVRALRVALALGDFGVGPPRPDPDKTRFLPESALTDPYVT